MSNDLINRNLALVQAHIEGEAGDPASIMPLYTADAVVEFPARGLRFAAPVEIEANYVRMFSSIGAPEITPLERFATDDRVVDDCIVRFDLIGDGMVNAPCAVGSRVELRLLHVFQIRDGHICRETVHEAWRTLA